jgi:hypothetical protein
MSRDSDITASPLIRNCAVTPRTGGLLVHVHPGLQQEFATLTSDIWRELLARFAAPLSFGETVRRSTVTALGFARYVVSRKDGRLTLEQRALSSSGRRIWRRASYPFAADLPLKPSTGLFEELLGEWAPQLAALARSAADISPLTAGLVRSVRKVTLRAVEWKRLRHAVREALALDPEILDLARRSRVNTHARDVTDGHYNRVAKRLAAYRQIHADNPNLLWLYALAQVEKINLPPKGEALATLREKILSDFSLPSAAWRYLANGRRRDFRVVLDWLGPHALPDGRWLELRDWLRVLVALERQNPVPLPVQRLFLHDTYRVTPDRQSVLFRSVTLPIATLRAVIAEAEAQLASGTLRTFAEDELPDVLAWLADSRSVLDERQQKAGWTYLLRRARDWKHDRALRDSVDSQSWTSMVVEHLADGLTVRPITDVWQLHREALGMRNCTNSFLADCMAGTVRLFALLNASGRQVGTIGLTREGRHWKVLDARGFANAAPSPAILGLANTLASRYTTLWLALHPLLAQEAAIPATIPVRQPEPCVPEVEADTEDCLDDEDDCCDEEDGWHDEDDDMVRHECPICGGENLDCEHLVAAVDYFNGGIYAGEMYQRQPEFLDRFWALITRAAAAGQRYSGLGKPVDDAIQALRNAGADSESAEKVREGSEWELINYLYQTLGNLPGVETSYWEFAGGSPGTSTCGRDYWSHDVEATLELLAEGLGIPQAAA